MSHDPADVLRSSFQRLQLRWQDVETNWNDAVKRDFEQRYLEPLAHHCENTYLEMKNMSELIANMRRSVS